MYQRKKNSNKNFIIPTEGVNRLEERFELLHEMVRDCNKNSAPEIEALTDEENIFPLTSIENVEELEKKFEEVSFFKKTVGHRHICIL
jgi:microsomal dipeptidase-like Zn-dependent dipeptidase